MAGFNKILNHPDKEWIIAMLVNGLPVREVEAKIKEKYSKRSQEALRISFSTLQNFRAEHLKLNDEMLNSVKEATQLQRDLMKNEAVKEQIRNSPSYQEKINEIVDEKLSVQREILKVFTVLESRIEYFYNKITEGDKIDVREERVFQGYLAQLTSTLDQYKKYVDGFQETSNVNISVNIAETQVSLIRESVREILAELDPTIAVAFLGKLNHKMNVLAYRADGATAGNNTDMLINNVEVSD